MVAQIGQHFPPESPRHILVHPPAVRAKSICSGSGQAIVTDRPSNTSLGSIAPNALPYNRQPKIKTSGSFLWLG